MGHANLSNISEFFINRLYARGQLSISDCAEQLIAAGETLHASEGEYDDYGMLSFGLAQVIEELTQTGDGSWIVPVLTAWHGGKRSITGLTRQMLDAIEQGDNDPLTVSGAADRLEEEGFSEWAAKVRALPEQRRVYREWIEDRNQSWEWEQDGSGAGNVFDSIPWRFAPGRRQRYREAPRLSNVSN